MAAFYRYTCLWHNCTKKCTSLLDLIDHIEMVHIERDPSVLEKQEASQPAAVALSYVNCFFSDALRRKKSVGGGSDSGNPGTPGKKSPSIKHTKAAVISSDNTDGFLDEEGSLSDATSDDSCQSWATNASQDSLPSDLMLNRLSHQEGDDGKKRFVCPVPGCGKRYKNVNGIKYHAKNGHRKHDSTPVNTTVNGTPGVGEIKKGYKCHCGKSYKSQSGLRHHQNTQHGKQTTTPKSTNHTQQLSTPSIGRVDIYEPNVQTVTPVT